MQHSLKLGYPAYAACLIILIFAAYLPIFIGPSEFIGDDYYYIVNNGSRVHVLTYESLKEIWTRPMQHDYLPVTITSFMADYALYGPNPRMFRITNLMIFFFIGITAFSVSRRMLLDASSTSKASHGLAFLSVILLLFHPINVEGVSLVSNRKELLYVLFGLLSFRLYIVSPGTAVSFGASLLLMIIAQLSKGTAVMLPAVFLLYSLLYEQRGQSHKRRLIALLPFFLAAGLIFSYQFSVASQSVVATSADIPFGKKIGGIVRVASTAIEHFLFPVNLAYDYDIRWPSGLNFGTEWILPSLIAGITVFLLFTKRYRSLFLMALIYIPFVPYLNIVPLTAITKDHMVYYDHYMLFPCMTASVLAARMFLSAPMGWKPAGMVFALAITGVFLFQDHYLAGIYKTRESLYTRNISVSPYLSRGYYYLAEFYIGQERYDKAIEYLTVALSVNRDKPDVNLFYVLGNAYSFSGRYIEAEKAYRTYLSTKPDDIQALQNLSSTLIMLKKNREAKEIIEQWLAISPDNRDALFNLSLIEKGSVAGETKAENKRRARDTR